MHRRKLVIASLLSIVLDGCVSSAPSVVDVPVVVKAAPLWIPPMPKLPIGKLTAVSQPAAIMKAYVMSVDMLIADDKLLRNQLLEVQLTS